MTPQRMLVLGATGPTGRHVIEQAVSAGHTVTGFARRPARLALRHPNLTLVEGDVTSAAGALERALAGQDVVICALGRGLALDSRGLMKRTAGLLVPLMELRGPRRLVVVSAYGVGDSFRGAPGAMRFAFGTLLRDLYADKAAADTIVRRSALDWTVVRPVILTNGLRTGRYRTGEHLAIHGFPSIARRDVAEFVLRCAGDPGTIRKTFVISP